MPPGSRRVAALALALIAFPMAGLGRAQSAPRPFAKPETPAHIGRARTFDLLHLKGDIALDFEAKEVRGRVDLTLMPFEPGLSSLVIDCGPAVEVEEVLINPGPGEAAARFRREGEELTIELGRTYRGERLTASVRYRAKPKAGLFFIEADDDNPEFIWTQGQSEDTRDWLPCYDSPDDKATTELIVTVKRPLSVLSNGRLVGTKENADGTRTFHWSLGVPHSTYLITLVAADFAVYRDSVGKLPVEYYVARGVDEATARRAMGRTPEMLTYFAEAFGVPYPFERYAQVCVPDFTNLGMENTTVASLTDAILVDPIKFQEGSSEDLISHELAHQWFGDLLTCRDWSEIWLNEGFATYAEALWEGRVNGEEGLQLTAESKLDAYLLGDQHVYRRPLVENRYKKPDDLYDHVAYDKAACVLHCLRGVLGDAAWWEGVRTFARSHRFGTVETADLRRAMERASGRDLGWFFRQWVEQAGHPELRISSRYDEEAGLLRVAIAQEQKIDEETPLFRIPTTLEVWPDRGEPILVPIEINAREQEFTLRLDAPPRNVDLDPEGWVPKRAKYAKSPEEWRFQWEQSRHVLSRLRAARELARIASRDREGDEAGAAGRALAGAWRAERQPRARAQVVGFLRRESREQRSALFEAARDREPSVRRAGFSVLQGAKFDADLERLCREAWGDPREVYPVRRMALSILSKNKVPDRAQLLEAAAETPSHREEIAGSALELLSQADGARFRDVALRIGGPGSPVARRRRAVEKLSELEPDKADAAVRDAFVSWTSDPDLDIRVAAWEALAKWKVADALPTLKSRLPLEGEGAKEQLEKAIRDLEGAR
jgi:aminopeptidase N